MKRQANKIKIFLSLPILILVFAFILPLQNNTVLADNTNYDNLAAQTAVPENGSLSDVFPISFSFPASKLNSPRLLPDSELVRQAPVDSGKEALLLVKNNSPPDLN